MTARIRWSIGVAVAVGFVGLAAALASAIGTLPAMAIIITLIALASLALD